MASMFYKFSSLKELNVSNFDTSNAYEIFAMFGVFSSLEELNLSNFNTEKLQV